MVNKKTKAVASSNSFKISAAAAAIVNGDFTGIMAALPLEKAELLLEKNEFVKKNNMDVKVIRFHSIIRIIFSSKKEFFFL